MSELIECKGTNCPLKNGCHRYNENPLNEYFESPPFDKKMNTCIMIWDDNSEWLYNELQRIVNPTN